MPMMHVSYAPRHFKFSDSIRHRKTAHSLQPFTFWGGFADVDGTDCWSPTIWGATGESIVVLSQR